MYATWIEKQRKKQGNIRKRKTEISEKKKNESIREKTGNIWGKRKYQEKQEISEKEKMEISEKEKRKNKKKNGTITKD